MQHRDATETKKEMALNWVLNGEQACAGQSEWEKAQARWKLRWSGMRAHVFSRAPGTWDGEPG